jgi:hypothetical protein
MRKLLWTYFIALGVMFLLALFANAALWISPAVLTASEPYVGTCVGLLCIVALCTSLPLVFYDRRVSFGACNGN